MTSSVGRATRPKNHYRPQTKNGRGRLEALRQKVARLNTKAGKAILFANLAKRWLDIVGGMMKPSAKFQKLLPLKDGIVELRHKGASYAIIADILRSTNVVVSHDTVARFCREVLELTPRTRRPRKASVKALQHDSTGHLKTKLPGKADSSHSTQHAMQSEKSGMPDFRPGGTGGPRITDPNTI
jgi:hypothetical protein